MSDATITRIASTLPGTTLIYHVMQNAGQSMNSGLEMLWSQEVSKAFSFQFNLIGYRNQIDAFSVFNLYPRPNSYTSETQEIYSGSVKWNGLIHLPNQWNAQFSAVYLAPDLIPQGKIGQRFSFDLGLKKSVNQGRGEYFINASDLLNSMVIRKDIQGKDFNLQSADYYETQVIRIGFAQKF